MEHTVFLMAMEPEVAALRARMSNVQTADHGVTYGELAGQPITAVLCGIGKVAAATATTLMAAERPRVILSAGVAGGVRADVAHGALLVVSGAVEHDYDLRPFVAERSHDFRGPRAWQADADTVSALHAAAATTGCTVVDAWTATGDQVVNDRERHGPILQLGLDVACVDMETSAVAYAATAAGIPWAGLRVISDSADEHLEADPVLTAALDAGALLADVLEHYLAAL